MPTCIHDLYPNSEIGNEISLLPGRGMTLGGAILDSGENRNILILCLEDDTSALIIDVDYVEEDEEFDGDGSEGYFLEGQLVAQLTHTRKESIKMYEGSKGEFELVVQHFAMNSLIAAIKAS